MSDTSESVGISMELSASSLAHISHSYADVDNFILLSNSSQHLNRSSNSRSSNSTFPVAVIALLTSGVCLLTTVGIGSWALLGGLEILTFGSVEDVVEVCLPCIQLKPSSPEDGSSSLLQELDVQSTNGRVNETKICCARNTAQYAILLKLILNKQDEIRNLTAPVSAKLKQDSKPTTLSTDIPKTSINPPSSISAHLLYQNMSMEDLLLNDTVQRWKVSNRNPSHVSSGLRFYDNKLYIQASGLYFVYCQILYDRKVLVNANSESHMISSVYVRRISVRAHPESRPDYLLKARHTRNSVDMDRHSSYAGGLFYLTTGDAIYVQVSNPAFISHDETASFFGLFKVGE